MKVNELKSVIVKEGYSSIIKFVDKLNEDEFVMNRATFYRKLSGKSEFSQSEIKAISTTLSLSSNQIMDIFFDQVVS